jgi:hypothetical protein
MEDVRLEGSRLSFVWRFGGAPIRLRGRLVEDRDGRERFLADAYLSGRLNLMLLEAP